MKKTIFIISSMLVLSFSTQAQSVKFGAKAGLNYANLTGSNITINSSNYETSAITSYHAGLVAEIGVIKGFAIQPELLYSTQGATYKNSVTEFTNKLGYVAIPVLAKISLSDALSLELGPQASFLLSEKDKFNAKDSKTFDFGLAGGLGVKITDSFFVQARYGLGLSEVSTEAKVKNSVVQISAGVFF